MNACTEQAPVCTLAKPCSPASCAKMDISLTTKPDDGQQPSSSAVVDKLATLVDADQRREPGEIDADGLPVPQGKIPLDSQFTTPEVKKLVGLAQKEGILQDSVSVKVLAENDEVGDKVGLTD